MENEIWKDVVGYEGFYQVSNVGRVKSLTRVTGNCPTHLLSKGQVLKPILGSRQCFLVSLSVNGKMKKRTVHQLVAESFLGHTRCGYDLVINHKDFNPLNNHVDNLEIVTARENGNQKHIKSSSQYVGVNYRAINDKWIARIVFQKKRIYLGIFDTELDASNAYEEKLKEINGK